MAKSRGYIVIDEERCKSCGLCVEACPLGLIRISDRINKKGYRPAEQYKEGCTACKMCATMCPDVAIEVYLNE